MLPYVFNAWNLNFVSDIDEWNLFPTDITHNIPEWQNRKIIALRRLTWRFWGNWFESYAENQLWKGDIIHLCKYFSKQGIVGCLMDSLSDWLLTKSVKRGDIRGVPSVKPLWTTCVSLIWVLNEPNFITKLMTSRKWAQTPSICLLQKQKQTFIRQMCQKLRKNQNKTSKISKKHVNYANGPNSNQIQAINIQESKQASSKLKFRDEMERKSVFKHLNDMILCESSIKCTQNILFIFLENFMK